MTSTLGPSDPTKIKLQINYWPDWNDEEHTSIHVATLEVIIQRTYMLLWDIFLGVGRSMSIYYYFLLFFIIIFLALFLLHIWSSTIRSTCLPLPIPQEMPSLLANMWIYLVVVAVGDLSRTQDSASLRVTPMWCRLFSRPLRWDSKMHTACFLSMGLFSTMLKITKSVNQYPMNRAR